MREEPRISQKKKIINFRDLEVWKLGKEIAIELYCITKDFPKHEDFGLTSQIRRAGISISSNIAEGFNRYHNKEYKQYLFIALGSCAELETQIEISKDLGYVSDDISGRLIEKLQYETKMLRNLIKKL